jgi:cytochrome c5
VTGGSVVRWTRERHDLYAQLTQVHGDLGALYRYAIDLASSSPKDSDRRVRDALVGHCLRELMNNFPEAIGDVEDFPERGRRGDDDLRDAVIDGFRGLPPQDFDDTNLDGLVTVTKGFVTSVGAWVEGQDQATTRAALRDSVTVLGRLDEHNPALRPWKAARKYVMKLTHLNLSARPSEPDRDADTELHLANIEAALRARLGGFFDVLAEFDDILAEANARVAEELQ